jgi:hypothetical protein
VIWDILALDAAFEAIPIDGAPGDWDDLVA